jgi:predicted nucleotidyltransferase
MSSIVALFPGKTLLDVLSLLLLHSGMEFYQRDIADQTGHALLAVQKALERIEQAGLLRIRKSGNRVYYRGNAEHPAFEDIRQMLIKTVGIAEPFREALEPLSGKIRAAFIYGSIAQGRETPESDIDLFIVGDIGTKEVVKQVGSLAGKLGREVNPVVFPPEELRDIVSKGLESRPFIGRVLEESKIWLIGNEDEFATLAGRKAD